MLQVSRWRPAQSRRSVGSLRRPKRTCGGRKPATARSASSLWRRLRLVWAMCARAWGRGAAAGGADPRDASAGRHAPDACGRVRRMHRLFGGSSSDCGCRRLKPSASFSWLNQTWQPSMLAALPALVLRPVSWRWLRTSSAVRPTRFATSCCSACELRHTSMPQRWGTEIRSWPRPRLWPAVGDAVPNRAQRSAGVLGYGIGGPPCRGTH